VSTDGNSLAGALAATLQAIEIHKLITQGPHSSIAGHEVFFDAQHPAHQLSRLDRNPRCRFSHVRYALREAPVSTLADAFGLTPGSRDEKSLFVPERPFVSRLLCSACGHEEPNWRIRDSLDVPALACPECANPRRVRGFDLAERLHGVALSADSLGRPLAELGLRQGDVFGIASAETVIEHFILTDPERGDPRPRGVSILVAGLGNIGSFLVPHLARMQTVQQITLCDPDIYEAGQQIGQDFPLEAVGRNKAEAQADRIRAIRPDLEVEAVPTRVEDLPMGRIHAAIIVSCLDSRAARLRLAARAWRVGSPFVDAAVGGGSSLLVRTHVVLPGTDAACFECSFEARDYETLEQVFPCDIETDRNARDAPIPVEMPIVGIGTDSADERIEVTRG